VRRFIRPIIVAVLGFALAPSPLWGADPEPKPILYIGNSYTSVNDLPNMIAELAKAGKQPAFDIQRELIGGATLEKHFNEGKGPKKIAEKKWELVVLQENSMRPITDPKAMMEYGKKLDAEIKKQKSKTLLYLTWARDGASENQSKITNAYRELAKEIGATIVPVGLAWEAALKDDPKCGLHAADKSHPTKKGTYLAACVFYGVLYGQSPVGLPGKPGGLDDADAKKLQEIAWKTVEASRTQRSGDPAR
jgi:hypothetical protein